MHGGKAVFRLHYIHICTFYVTFSLFHWVDKLIKKRFIESADHKSTQKNGGQFLPQWIRQLSIFQHLLTLLHYLTSRNRCEFLTCKVSVSKALLLLARICVRQERVMSSSLMKLWILPLPRPCMASSQAFSVNAFRWRVREKRLKHSLGPRDPEWIGLGNRQMLLQL